MEAIAWVGDDPLLDKAMVLRALDENGITDRLLDDVTMWSMVGTTTATSRVTDLVTQIPFFFRVPILQISKSCRCASLS